MSDITTAAEVTEVETVEVETSEAPAAVAGPMSAKTKALVAAVRAYALVHYNIDGWHVIVDTWSDEEIAAEIKGTRTEKGAIAKMAPAAAVFAASGDAVITTDTDAAPVEEAPAAPAKKAKAKAKAEAAPVEAAPVDDPFNIVEITEPRVCVVCETEKPITSFPTTGRHKVTMVMGRGKTCRACRDDNKKSKA